MRQKEWRVIITFHTTAEAMACELLCKQERMPGRMIPVPREISSGCGLAWCAGVEEKMVLEKFFLKKAIIFEDMVLLEY